MLASVVIPPPLRHADRVAIIAPASAVRPEYVEGACLTLRAWGFQPVVMPHTLTRFNTYSATISDRLADMEQALRDPSIRAILCARGGHGCIDLLSPLHASTLVDPANPKWLMGFSDITYLHALWLSRGIASLHCNNARGLAQGPDHPDNEAIRRILFAPPAQHPQEPVVAGGNLSIVASLIGTPWDMTARPCRLFVEDLNEPLYKAQRAMQQILWSASSRLESIALGEFIDIRYNSGDPDILHALALMASQASIPCTQGLPVGHGAENTPILIGYQGPLISN